VDQIKFQGGYCALSDAEPTSYPVTVFPNPANTVIQLKWDQLTTGIYRLGVFNTYGELVLGTDWIVNDAQFASLDAGILPKGFYIVKKQDADGYWAVGKFVKY
jgi:hypothetical protein